MQEYYKILGVSEDCSNEELELAYNTLKNKYSRDRFIEGEYGNEAARKLTKIENAYAEIVEERKNHKKEDSNTTEGLYQVEELIKSGQYDSAQEALDNLTVRDAEWHYLQSIIFYKKNWSNESLKQLEICKEMDPTSAKYADAYDKLKKKIEFKDSQFTSGNATSQGSREDSRMMGGDNFSDCFNCCTTWCCMEMLCNCCR